MFIFEVLLEALLCGDTVFLSENFSDGYSDLKRNNPLTDKPYIEEQLRVSELHCFPYLLTCNSRHFCLLPWGQIGIFRS